MMNQIFALLVVLVPFVSSAHPVDSLITEVDANTSIWISPQSIQHHYFLESVNAGKDWDTVRFNYLPEINYPTFSLDFNLPSPVLVLSDSNWVIPGFDGSFSYRGAFLISKDRGRNWEYLETDKEIRSLGMFEVHFSDEKNGVLVSYADVWNSEDGGYTWRKNTTVKNKKKDLNYFKMFFFDDLVGVIKGRYNYWFTKDGGKTWSEEIGEINDPDSDVSLKHALLSMRLDVLSRGMSTAYLYDLSDQKNIMLFRLTYRQGTSESIPMYPLDSRMVSFLSSGTTHIRITKELKTRLELADVSFKPEQIVVFVMDFELNKLEIDEVATAKINEMFAKLRAERPFELLLFNDI